MKQNITTFKTSLLLAGSLVLAASCQDYEPFSEQQVQDRAYTREFERQFGQIDPNQNWDLFGQLARKSPIGTRAAGLDGVSVQEEPETVLITQSESNEFAKVMPEINIARWDYSLTNLGRVTDNFASTSTEFTITPIFYWTDHFDDVIGVYWYIDESEYDSSSSSDEEIHGSDGETYYIRRKDIYNVKDNLIGVKEKDLYYQVKVSDIDFDALIVAAGTGDGYNCQYSYAAQGQTGKDSWNNNVTFSVGDKIYYDGANYRKFDWTDNYVGNNIPTALAQDLVKFNPAIVIAVGGETIVWGPGSQSSSPANYLLRVERQFDSTGINGNSVQSENYFTSGGAEYLQSTPITVTLTGIPIFGFYLTNGSGTNYSESKLNAKYNFYQGETPKGQVPVSYISTFDMHDIDPDKYPSSLRYLCFEDWFPTGTNNSSDFDLNDCVFKLVMHNGHVVNRDNTTEEALLVCEDLTSYDFDFNDVVLKLNYTKGYFREYEDTNDDGVYELVNEQIERYLEVTPLAAGGAYSSWITVNGIEKGEIHSLLGEAAGVSAHGHTPINADPEFGSEGEPFLIIEGLPDEDASYPTYLSRLFQYQITKADQSKEDFFKILCDQNKEAAKLISNNSYTEGSAPQKMLLPIYFEWPQEEVYIKDAYNGFEEWVKDIEQTDWIFTSQDELTVTDRGDFSSMFENPGEVMSVQELQFQNDVTFSYTDKNNKVTYYPHCSMVSFAGLTVDADAYAELKVTFTQKPTGETYLDFSDGKQMVEDKMGSVTERTYKLSSENLHHAISCIGTNGCENSAIYFMARGGAPVVISKAVLTIKR